jgi:hypothetical protein
MNKGMIVIIIVLVVGYVIGAKYPGMCQRLGIC